MLVSRRFAMKDQRFIHYVAAEAATEKLLASQLAQLKSLLTGDGHAHKMETAAFFL